MFKVDFINGKTISWTKKGSGAEAQLHPDYYPRFYIEGELSKLQKSRSWLSRQKGVRATCFEEWKPTLSKPEKKVLRVDTDVQSLRSVANRLKKKSGRSTFRFYNVGFSPQFRFCLQKEICPTPENELDKIELGITRKDLADQKFSQLKINGKELGGSTEDAFGKFVEYWNRVDPDLIMLERGQILELIRKTREEVGSDFSLGRMESFQKLADGNTVSSYGKKQHKSARYNIPGRIVIDRSNSFILKDATLEGMWDLVRRSYRPMQELAWGSIGRLLTSIEVRKAYLEKDILTPWKNWRGEKPKKASTMHKADRGGFIFNPEPEIYEDVYEADFASLFPNIMVKKNISPETVNCSCCNNSKVPELDFSICQENRGFISEVLKPLVEDRQKMKERLKNEELDTEEEKFLQGSVDAIKWLLVSCFGYMGHAHASYGAIECHQAIQAYDRDIMVKTKEMFEEAGYSIIHGIIDSIWVQKREDAEDFEQVCRMISDEIGIMLEPEHHFEWCGFVPRSSSKADISTLNRYFGKKSSGGFKTAGIEVEQRSTSKFIKKCQMEMIKKLDRNMDPNDALKVVRENVLKLKNQEVDPEDLVRTRKVSKSLDDYQVKNRGYAALKRSRSHGIDVYPGQSVNFVIRDDNAEPLDRVRLQFEKKEKYDPDFYIDQLIRAAESVLSPLGPGRDEIRSKIGKNKNQKQADLESRKIFQK